MKDDTYHFHKYQAQRALGAWIFPHYKCNRCYKIALKSWWPIFGRNKI